MTGEKAWRIVGVTAFVMIPMAFIALAITLVITFATIGDAMRESRTADHHHADSGVSVWSGAGRVTA